MRQSTKDYIEFFKLNNNVEVILDRMFEKFSELPTESDYFLRLRNSFDLTEMNECVARGIEDIFSDDELSQIIDLYRRNPVLMKVVGSQGAIFELGERAAQDMVRRAAERVPYVVAAGVC